MNSRTGNQLVRISTVIGVAVLLAVDGSHVPSYAQQPVETIAIDVSQPGAAIPRGLFGLFFEYINFAADDATCENHKFRFPVAS